jgi:hypothetical protein
MKTRYFPFDAFLSHNQNDGSHLVHDGLTRLGARSWHDGYADITDRLVQARLRGAIVGSRYICVCIGQAFRDSEWVQIEYRAGLEKDRAMVIAMDASPAIPVELKRERIFPIHSEGLEPLARFLISENTRGDSGLTGEDEARRVSTALALRSSLQGQTRLTLSLIEQARLAKERMDYVLAQPDAERPAFDLSMLIHHLSNGSRRFLGGYFMPDEDELRSVVLDMFEALSRHPAAVRKLESSVGRPDYDFLDPLIDLMQYPAEAPRAIRLFETMSALLDEVWRTNPVTRKDMAAFRWHAAQVRAGKPFASSRERRNDKLRRERR